MTFLYILTFTICLAVSAATLRTVWQARPVDHRPSRWLFDALYLLLVELFAIPCAVLAWWLVV